MLAMLAMLVMLGAFDWLALLPCCSPGCLTGSSVLSCHAYPTF